MAEAKDKTVNEEPKVLTITEKVDDKDVNKQYLIEKADVLINHYMAELKNNLPEEMEEIDEDAKSGDNKPN
mgnify:CR=1 FL=1